MSFFSLLVSAQDTSDAEKDRQYVTDQLRLSLYQEPNSSSKVVKLLNSGDLVVIDEIRGPYALVTAPGGSRGWVKRGFLVTNPTAAIQLREEQQKNASLFEEIEKLSDAKLVIDAYEKDMDALVEKNEVLAAEKELAAATIMSLEQQLAEKQQEVEETEAVPPTSGEVEVKALLQVLVQYWKIIVPFLLVLLGLSFLITKLVVEARIKSKFHGIKIW